MGLLPLTGEGECFPPPESKKKDLSKSDRTRKTRE